MFYFELFVIENGKHLSRLVVANTQKELAQEMIRCLEVENIVPDENWKEVPKEYLPSM
jgi:hypothetical protein